MSNLNKVHQTSLEIKELEAQLKSLQNKEFLVWQEKLELHKKKYLKLQKLNDPHRRNFEGAVLFFDKMFILHFKNKNNRLKEIDSFKRKLKKLGYVEFSYMPNGIAYNPVTHAFDENLPLEINAFKFTTLDQYIEKMTLNTKRLIRNLKVSKTKSLNKIAQNMNILDMTQKSRNNVYKGL